MSNSPSTTPDTPLTDALDYANPGPGEMAAHARKLELSRSALVEALEAQDAAEEADRNYHIHANRIFLQDAFNRTADDQAENTRLRNVMIETKARAKALRASSLAQAREV